MKLLLLLGLMSAGIFSVPSAEPARLEFIARSRVRSSSNTNDFQVAEKKIQWDPRKTAIVVCDMWDKHWCKGASERVAEMAPTMNQVLQLARAQGVFVIHAPSDTIKFYENTPQRKLAREAPKAPLNSPLKRWTALTPGREARLPIDDTDGGCDCQPQCKTFTAWKKEIDLLEIDAADAITDDGNEVYNLMQQRGIENLIVMGVHANMCVLGRSFSIRQMVNLGKNVLLMRDLTDSMYNSRMAPFVNHFRGTDLVIEHIEKYWCPSVTSTGFTGKPAFRFREDAQAKAGGPAAGNETVAAMVKTFQPRGQNVVPGAAPSAPASALQKFKTVAGLELELVAAEPVIRQPVSMTFDERGRLWVVQYLQYPFPAGLKVVKYDEYLRAVFDKVPPPPPHHVRGADRITILEDKDGDGVFETHKDFLDGLNIATSVLPGRGGVYVLNPPYLLFYADRNRDDIPDGDPEVLLSGFGLEDTHAVANSLTWGPDGWIYGGQGSTCTANVKGKRFLGQAIWRFHPVTHDFELFAEGGGNTFGIEIDTKGRIFSGHNGDGTRGFHFVQGGYYQKIWGKHGPLTNPHAYGFFPFMKHEGEKPRFSHSLIVYEGGELPFEGQMLSILPLHSRVQLSSIERDGSTLRTVDKTHLVDSDDPWFRPVDIKAGPDGAVYIADWYDIRLTHLDPRDNWDRSNGRIYRLKSKQTVPRKPFDLAAQTGDELVSFLSHSNKWFRQQALRVLGDRRDPKVIPRLTQLLRDDAHALEALWALHLSGGWSEKIALSALNHRDPHVRRWAIRLLGDDLKISGKVRDEFLRLAKKEGDAEVRSQLASTARRLSGRDALPIIEALGARNDDDNDPQIPLLLWWALEDKAISHREAVVNWLRASPSPLVSRHLIARLAQRYAAEQSDEGFGVLATLFEIGIKANRPMLLRGLRDALKNVIPDAVPEKLLRAIAFQEGDDAALLQGIQARFGIPEAVTLAVQALTNQATPHGQRLELIEVLGQRKEKKAVPGLVMLFLNSSDANIQKSAASALQNFDEPAIAEKLLTARSRPDERPGAPALLTGLLSKRASWALALLREVDRDPPKGAEVSRESLDRIRLYDQPEIQALLRKHWGSLRSSPSEKQERMAQVAKIVAEGKGNVARGKELFTTACGSCHKLFGEGATLAPELTGYDRQNLDFLLVAIVDPSAGIREEYLNFELEKRDGLTLTGLLVEQNPQTVIIEDPQEGRTTVARRDIKSLRASAVSRMPEGLLDAFNAEQVRDLFAYLRSQPSSVAANR